MRQLLSMTPWIGGRRAMARPFYGWVIVGVGSVVSFTQVSFFNPVLGVLVNPLSEEFGWNRATISAAITIGTLGGAIISPPVGRIVDRWGSRVVVTAGTALMGVCLLALALTPSLVWFYVFYGTGRMIAAGASYLGMNVTVSNWFVRNRGLALGVTMLGHRAGMALLPLSIQLVLLAASWRAAWVALGVVVLSVGVLPSARLLRRRPEDMGLLPDGRSSPGSAEHRPERAAADLEEQWTLREAAGTSAFWLLTLATSQVFLVGGAVNLHQMPHLVDRGLSPTLAVGVVSVFAIFGAVGSLLGGLAHRRFGARWTLAGSMAGAASGLVLLINADNPASAYLYGVWYGLVFGSMLTMMEVVYAEYFGRESLGSIRGAVAPFQMVLNAIGPLLAGWAFDAGGTYVWVLWGFAATLLLAAIWTALARPPRRSAGVMP